MHTSGNELIKEQLEQKRIFFKQDFETLILGGVVQKSIDPGLVFIQLKTSRDAIWGLLLFSGYLTLNTKAEIDGPLFSCHLKIPNQEILTLFQTMIRDYFVDTFLDSWSDLLIHLTQGNVEAFSEEFQKIIMEMFSSHDISKNAPERIYHAFVLGLFASLREIYEIKSNQESGLGRFDVCLFPKNKENLGIILDFKKGGKKQDLKAFANSAIEQIEDLHYLTEFQSRGIVKVLALGMAFQGKTTYIQSKNFHNF